MSYTKFIDSPLGKFLTSLESRLKDAQVVPALRDDKTKTAIETDNQIQELLDLISKLRSVLNVYSEGGSPGFTDAFTIPTLLRLKNKREDYLSINYKIYDFLDKNLQKIIERNLSSYLTSEVRLDEVRLEHAIQQLRAHIKFELLKNTLLKTPDAGKIIEDILESVDLSRFNKSYFANKDNNFSVDFSFAILQYLKRNYLSQPFQHIKFQIKHPVLFDFFIELAKLLSSLPDDVAKLLSFLNPAAIESTSKLIGKPMHHTGDFVFVAQETPDNKRVIDIKLQYKRNLPVIFKFIDAVIFNYFKEFAETPKVKSEQAKSELIQQTIDHLNRDLLIKVRAIPEQAERFSTLKESANLQLDAILHELVQRFDNLEQLTLASLEQLKKQKANLISRLTSTRLIDEINAESPVGQLNTLLSQYNQEGLDTSFVEQDLLTTYFVRNLTNSAHLTSVSDYIAAVFKKLKLEIEEPLNQAKMTILQDINQYWQLWATQELEKHEQATATISESANVIKAQAEQVRVEVSDLPGELNQKISYFEATLVEIESKKQQVQSLQKELNLQANQFEEFRLNARTPDDFSKFFGQGLQQRINIIYEEQQNDLVEVNHVLNHVNDGLIQQENEINAALERAHFEKRMSDSNPQELKSILQEKSQALVILQKDLNDSQLQILRTELDVIQASKPTESSIKIQERIQTTSNLFNQTLEILYTNLSKLLIPINEEKPQELVESLRKLAQANRLEVIMCLENLLALHEVNVVNENCYGKERIFHWIEGELIPAAKQDLSVNQLAKVFEKAKDFNQAYLIQPLFDIICPEIKFDSLNKWKEFYQSLQKIHHPSIFSGETTKANNKEKLKALGQVFNNNSDILFVKPTVEKLIHVLKDTNEKLTQDEKDIATLTQEKELQEKINPLTIIESQIIVLKQEELILEKIIALLEKNQTVTQAFNDLKTILTSPNLMTVLIETELAMQKLQQVLAEIVLEIEQLKSLPQLDNANNDYALKVNQLSDNLSTLQQEVDEVTSTYYQRLVSEFSLESETLNKLHGDFNLALEEYRQNRAPTLDSTLLLFKQLEALKKAKKDIKEKLEKIPEALKATINKSAVKNYFINSVSEELIANSLVRKMKEYIDTTAAAAKETCDRVVLTDIKAVHLRPINIIYSQEIADANRLVNAAINKSIKIKELLQVTPLRGSAELLKLITTSEVSSTKVRNEIIAKAGCVNIAQIRIIERQKLSNQFKQALQTYLDKRAEKYNIKDKLIPIDKNHREAFVSALKDRLDNYTENGDSQLILELIRNNKSKFPGQYLQPLLNRLILAIQNHDKTLPQAYNADFTEEIHLPKPNLEEAPRVLQRLQLSKSTKELAAKIKQIYQDIEDMLQYGKTLNYECGTNKELSQTPIELAEGLKERLDEFLVVNEDKIKKPGATRNQLMHTFYQDFDTHLYSQADTMSEHRDKDSWKPIVANIALNLLALLKLAVSKIITGHASFFFQQTTRMEKVEAIEQSLISTVESSYVYEIGPTS
ncbi:Uncharacterised protein [Legionella beliardensis]|uniref:Uncharacterized protein n=1 Tax=Legionella beliardensis TaxID=91822 RepID=A0A378I388_9GAMM|nr:hypothetical protein [Legionella beliardensis]STX29146.1 Uncharacterised protein [Legionella beliardensis]